MEDEDEAPMASLAAYRDEVSSASPDLAAAGRHLGRAAILEVTPEVVNKVNDLLGVKLDAAAEGVIASAAEDERQKSRESHSDSESTEHSH